MTAGWAAFEALATHGWSRTCEHAALDVEMTAEAVEQNADPLVRATLRLVREGHASLADLLLDNASEVLDPLTNVAIGLRTHAAVLAVVRGAYDEARTILDDALIDAGRAGSSWMDAIRANLATVALGNGDLPAVKRWLAMVGTPDSSGPGVVAAAVSAAFARVKADRAAMYLALATQRRL